ncbi:MAG: PepSY-like domain-containing protein [Proteiniphilum sp.]|jgi:hypothetical protein|nr:PepSY-like domain-containing protein [Proteiniphilum sp.]
MKQRPFNFVVLSALTVIALLLSGCDDDYLPAALTTEVSTFVMKKYPGALILEVEREEGRRIEVSIIHGNTDKEVLFDLKGRWLQTSWDVSISDLPQAVREALTGSAFAGYRIDDADFVETAYDSYYLLELERGRHEMWVRIDGDGRVLN